MAADTAVRFSATVEDETGVKGSVLTHAVVDSADTIATLVTAQQAWVSAVDGVSGAKVISSGMTFSPALPGGIKGAAIAGARVEQTGVLNLGNNTTPYRYGVTIPALKDSLIVAGRINLTDALITTFTTLLTSAVGGGAYTNLARQTLTGVIDAVLSFRKHRRERTRTSFEL